MKHISLLLSLSIFALFSGCNRDRKNSVNPIIGDISFVKKFGFRPDEKADNDLRIKTHLQYAARMLRVKDASFLSKDLRERRAHLIDLLDTYAAAGNFPRNYDYADQRKPCFIDKDKRICAVGYLIEKTVGRHVAEKINVKYQYNEILEMESEDVEQWIASSGLSKKECAMIQPTYGPHVPQPGSPPVVQAPTRIKPGYAATSGALTGINALLSISHEVDLSDGRGNKIVPILALIGGTSQITLGGLGFYLKDNPAAGLDYTNSRQRTLSAVNIGIGAATVLLSIRNLAWQRKMANQRNAWNVFSFPAGSKHPGVGLSFSRKI